eukprot:SAG31_NODE_5283_length_2633_cov_1.701263_3_plen_550_part_00
MNYRPAVRPSRASFSPRFPPVYPGLKASKWQDSRDEYPHSVAVNRNTALSTNLLAGLTTSFAALALGAAFGASTGRGALIGGLSAGLIPVITSTLGGTRVQVSGPTTPMSAVLEDVVQYSRGALFSDLSGIQLNASSPGCDPVNYDSQACPLPDRFVNIVLLICGTLVILMGLLQLGRFITLVPNVVISGFQNGIALHMWHSETKKLSEIHGWWELNIFIAATTTTLCVLLPRLFKAVLSERVSRVVPGTLCAIGLVSIACLPFRDCLDCDDCSACIEKTQLGKTQLQDFADLHALVVANCPRVEDIATDGLLRKAIPIAVQLAVLCYIDTLLTSLVIDKMVAEDTNRGKELCAQGFANCVVSLIGGLPGAQSTSRSVLVLDEGGSTRLAGVAAGFFVIAEVLLLQRVVAIIPIAVFCGVLLNVGWKLFDHAPVRTWIRQNVLSSETRTRYISEEPLQHESAAAPVGPSSPRVSNLEVSFIAGTAVVTVCVGLNWAVGIFTILFHLVLWVSAKDARFKMDDLMDPLPSEDSCGEEGVIQPEVEGEQLSG